MTTHGCGHCHETFTTRDALRAHLGECSREVCGACGDEFEDAQAYRSHRPCGETPRVPDPEAEFRSVRRERERIRRREERQRERRRFGRRQ